ncbi:MAG: hypothetical protein EP330_10120 [Deltaproteobacteria bacterium]|nr:MAG: hypothetical protein EP330_10120 [Deltaproteobacteria bacterium]
MKPTVAWLGHLASPLEYQVALAALRGPDLPVPALDKVAALVERLSPMPACTTEVPSLTGSSVHGVYIDAFLLIDGRDGMSLRAALRKVRAACAAAARAGAKVGALGGFTSIVGERSSADLSAEFGLPFTTGNTLTAACLAAQVESVADASARVVLVGGAGDVGSGVARILHARGYRPVLVGRRPQPLAALAEELPGVSIATWEEAAPTADVAVLVASTGPGGIDVSAVPHTTPILDAGHPPNASPGHPMTATAGRVAFALPERGGLPEFISSGCDEGEHHACMVEGAVLGLEGWFEPYSQGRGLIRPDRAAKLLDAAARHGMTPGPLRYRRDMAAEAD